MQRHGENVVAEGYLIFCSDTVGLSTSNRLFFILSVLIYSIDIVVFVDQQTTAVSLVINVNFGKEMTICHRTGGAVYVFAAVFNDTGGQFTTSIHFCGAPLIANIFASFRE
jgi:hypothetical protein